MPDFYCPACDVFDRELHQHTDAEVRKLTARRMRAEADRLWAQGRKTEATDLHNIAAKLEKEGN